MANNYQYLDSNGLTTLWGIIKNRFGRVDSILLNGTSATTTDEGGKIVNIPAFGPGTLSYPGLVPSPGTSSTAIFLRGDGTWAQPIGSTYAAGTYLTLSGTTINHDNSGVTAGSKGDTSAKTPGFGGTFKALSGTVDAQGHLTAFAEHNVTIPSATATTAANGLMSSTDKIKLNSVASSAEVNQNAFSNIKVGSSTVAADSKTDTFTLVGSGSISLSANTSTDTVTITGTDTTYAVATSDSDGLMSAADKQTLDNIVTTGGEPNQDAFSYIVAGGSTVAADDKKDTLTLVGAGSVSLSAATGTDTITITGSTSVATTAANGLMSSSDKIKLNGIEDGAETNQNAFAHVLMYDVTGLPKVGGVNATNSTDQIHLQEGSNILFSNYAVGGRLGVQIDLKSSPNLTGTPTAPTPGASSTATMIANKKYVDDSISAAISGAASFQGTATSTYPAAIENHEAGQYWLVTQDGKYVDGAFECQPGDMIFAIATAGTTADFTVIQQNLSPITTDDINTICV